MGLSSAVDTVLDRTVVLGYGNVGLTVRKLLPGWPADPPRMDGRQPRLDVLVNNAGRDARQRQRAEGGVEPAGPGPEDEVTRQRAPDHLSGLAAG
ncbi:MAG TPA: hypothetical protein VGH99_21075 [Pseudonocardia sp.]|jgi:hypothetical protein